MSECGDAVFWRVLLFYVSVPAAFFFFGAILLARDNVRLRRRLREMADALVETMTAEILTATGDKPLLESVD